MTEHHLDLSVKRLRGVGETRARHLARLGISTIRDFFSVFPRRYEDRRSVVAIRDLVDYVHQDVGVVVTVQKVVFPSAAHSGGRTKRPTVALVSDPSGSIDAVWFSTMWRRVSLKPGMLLFLFGNVQE